MEEVTIGSLDSKAISYVIGSSRFLLTFDLAHYVSCLVPQNDSYNIHSKYRLLPFLIRKSSRYLHTSVLMIASRKLSISVVLLKDCSSSILVIG